MRQPPPLTDLPRYPVTGGLALLAAGVTIAAKAGGVDVSPLLESHEIRQGQVWRLVTSILPHGSPLHLLFNLYWLWIFGTLVEQTYGHVRTFALVLLLGVGSASAEYALLFGGIGLSGVNYGLFGMLWVLSRYHPRFAYAVDPNTTLLMVAWFFICIGTTITGVMPVANVAHGMGAVLGALLGMAIVSRAAVRRAAFVAALVVVTGASVAGAFFRPWVNLSRDRGQEWARIGFFDLQADRDEEALHHLRRAVEIDPELAWAWYNLGVACNRQGLEEEAARAFDRAARLEPTDTDYKKAAERSHRRQSVPENDADQE